MLSFKSHIWSLINELHIFSFNVLYLQIYDIKLLIYSFGQDSWDIVAAKIHMTVLERCRLNVEFTVLLSLRKQNKLMTQYQRDNSTAYDLLYNYHWLIFGTVFLTIYMFLVDMDISVNYLNKTLNLSNRYLSKL